MNMPSKSKYPIRNLVTEGFMEYMQYGMNGSGISRNTDYESWKYNRHFVSQAMMTPEFSYKVIERTIGLYEEMESYWNNLEENRELDLKKWIYRFTNEIVFEILTGVKNNSVACYYSTLIHNDSLSLNEKETERFIQSLEIFDRGNYLFDKINNIIKERRIEIENTPLNQPLRHDLLTSYLTANTPRDINFAKHGNADFLRPMTESEIFGNVFDSLLGGGTMSNLICFVIYHIETYPEVKQRIRQEIETVLGNDLTTPITSKDLDELRYCDAVIKEVHRYHPISFSIPRVNVEKDEIGGISWPEKTSFQMLYGVIMKNKNYWTDPEKFDPDRFYELEKSEKYLLERQHIKDSFTIWGGGIRICPGRKWAIIELKILLSMIYRKYDIEIADINEPFKSGSGLLR
ncbi:1561_t:CDS:2, partial [Ambispora gerdemannii]